MHTMYLDGEFLGVETWKCPECGRVVLVRWHPYERVVDVEGDPNAGHTAFRMAERQAS